MLERLFGAAPVRRLAWRAGRRLYCAARGESPNDMAHNGESYVQAAVIAACAKAGSPMTVFDIGANQGAWTRQLLGLIPPERVEATQVHMFEPVPSTQRSLRRNLAADPRGRIAELHSVAISDTSGTAEMVIMSETGGTNTLEFDADVVAKAREVATIEKTTLTEFCRSRSIPHIHLLKSDTEGHDAVVLRGARELLIEGRIDVVQFEYNHRWVYARAFLKDVFDLVAGLPYHVARTCPRRIEVFDAWHPETERFFEANYLIVREPALAWFDARRGAFDASNTYGCS